MLTHGIADSNISDCTLDSDSVVSLILPLMIMAMTINSNKMMEGTSDDNVEHSDNDQDS